MQPTYAELSEALLSANRDREQLVDKISAQARTIAEIKAELADSEMTKERDSLLALIADIVQSRRIATDSVFGWQIRHTLDEFGYEHINADDMDARDRQREKMYSRLAHGGRP
jgi:hypothetical protein